MSRQSHEIGDVIVKRLTIKSASSIGAGIIPFDQVVSFDIWEDVTKPTMYATLIMFDTLGLLEKFPILGEELIELEIQTPGMSVTSRFVFRCFEVTNVQRVPNGKGVSYTLRCVSEEHLRNGGTLVRESMTDVASAMVPYILQKHLQSTKQMIIDETKGIQTIVFPKLSPLEAIDMLRLRAVSKSFTSSSYVFFENQAGFNFKTIEGLYKDGLANIGTRVFNAHQNVMGSKEAQGEAYRTLQSYQLIHRADGVRKIAQGAYRSVTRVFDMATKKFETIPFDVEKNFASFETAVKKAMPNTDEWINEYTFGVPRQFVSVKDTSRPDNFITNTIGIRNSFTELLNDDITRVLIHGDTQLKAGDVVTLNLPQVDGLSSRKKADRMTSGNYLITRLRHMISFNIKTTHEIVFDCVKMGV